MALFGYPGKLLAKDSGKLAASSACCCDDAEDEPPPPPPPADPSQRCSCGLFATCTTTISYDGLVVSLQSSVNNSVFYTKNAGVVSYGTGSPGSIVYTLTMNRFLSVGGCFPYNTATGSVLCGSPNSQAVQYHLVVNHSHANAVTPFRGVAETTSFYKYELSQGSSVPCPDSLSGLQVTVREVARTRGGTPVRGTCDPSCETVLDSLRTSAFPAGFLSSSSTNPFDWRDAGGVPVNPGINFTSQPQQDDSWLCQHPIWNKPQRPTVTVACAP
jgi:hypothetical protein